MFVLFFSSNQKVTLAQQQLQSEYEKLKLEESEKSQKLQELMSVDVLTCKRSFHVPTTDPTTNQNHPVLPT
jgi:hypothetical protein